MSSPVSVEPAALGSLDAVGVHYGAQISSTGRNCLRAWEPFLAPLRDQSFDLLHIGIGDGASLRTWREWFPAARLVGLDARRIVLDPPIADCITVQGNQTDIMDLRPLLREYCFRLVIADGSHHDDDQIRAFELLFPWLDANSIYICAGFENRPYDPAESPQGDDRRSGPGWFAELGLALAGNAPWSSSPMPRSGLDDVKRVSSGVYLARGNVVVTR